MMAKKTGSKNPAAVELGKLGGTAWRDSHTQEERKQFASQGGKARAQKLSAAKRKRIAKAAVAKREEYRRQRKHSET